MIKDSSVGPPLADLRSTRMLKDKLVVLRCGEAFFFLF